MFDLQAGLALFFPHTSYFRSHKGFPDLVIREGPTSDPRLEPLCEDPQRMPETQSDGIVPEAYRLSGIPADRIWRNPRKKDLQTGNKLVTTR